MGEACRKSCRGWWLAGRLRIRVPPSQTRKRPRNLRECSHTPSSRQSVLETSVTIGERAIRHVLLRYAAPACPSSPNIAHPTWNRRRSLARFRGTSVEFLQAGEFTAVATFHPLRSTSVPSRRFDGTHLAACSTRSTSLSTSMGRCPNCETTRRRRNNQLATSAPALPFVRFSAFVPAVRRRHATHCDRGRS